MVKDYLSRTQPIPNTQVSSVLVTTGGEEYDEENIFVKMK